MNQQPYTVNGYQRSLTVTPTTVILQGKLGYKEILIREITAITISKASRFGKGSIRFSYRGGSDQGMGYLNPNTLLFDRKQEPAVLQAKAMVDHYRAAYQQQYAPNLRQV